MTYKKLTPEQRGIKRWRDRRNHLVTRLLLEDQSLLRAEALKKANRLMHANHEKKQNPSG